MEEVLKLKSAIEKTAALIRKDVPLSLLDRSVINPNEMSKAAFNMLVSNMEQTGITDALLVRALPTGRYRLIGGNHRLDAAELLGFTSAPCSIITDPDFGDDAERFQIVRMNMIRGKLNPKKFVQLYNALDTKYESDLMAEAFGFEDEDQFKRLIGEMAKTLPSSLQDKFKEAAAEIKTVDGLSKLLNQMFTKHGDTLPWGYMLIDFGTKESVWLRMHAVDKKKFLDVAAMCVEKKRSVDSLMRLVLQSIAAGKLPDLMKALEDFPEVEVKDGEIPLESGLPVNE